jgi:hypothetical protein
VHDNLFDNVSLSTGSTFFPNSNNGYSTNTTALPYSSGGDKTGLIMDYRSGPAADGYGVLGGFYYPCSGGAASLTNLVNAGSRTAAAAGLYHYTTGQGKEGASQVDIGFHYVEGDSTAGLVGHWKLDEGTGTSAADRSGYGNTGTLRNGPVWAPGALSYALRLDGTNDDVEVASSTSLSLTSAVTLSVWINQDTLQAGNKEILFKGADAANTGSRCNYGLRATGSGKLQFIFRNAADTMWVYYQTPSAVITAGTWYHVAAVHTFGSGANTKLYVNGVSQTGSWLYGTGNEPPMTAAKPLWLGSVQNAGVNINFWNGLLDDARVYNRALTLSEISQLAGRLPGGADSDGDSLPDYLEDRNGNGTYDPSSETDWQTGSSGITGAAGLQVFTPLR